MEINISNNSLVLPILQFTGVCIVLQKKYNYGTLSVKNLHGLNCILYKSVFQQLQEYKSIVVSGVIRC